jgi:hypothetical protein
MNLRDYTKKRKIIFTAEILLLTAGTIAVFTITESLTAAAVAGAFLLILCGLNYLQYRIDDRYISGVTDDLSRLCDNLTTLEEHEIFPENEDTMLSKLQSKIIKLVRILKHKNERSLSEQENIKSLVSDISHQLKTPIANLKMYTEFLEGNIGEEQRKEYVEIIKMSVERLNFLSESMIKISRLESGLINLRPQMQSLNETVMVSIKNVFAKAKAKDIEITYLGENTEVFHDKRWTAEAVFNLLDNAVKYGRSGTKIALSVKKYGMFSAVEVVDENEPIPEEERSKIFSRFYRGRNAVKTEGIGVGLYLAREIVVKQGGYVNLSSSEKGNVFAVFLPMRSNQK